MVSREKSDFGRADARIIPRVESRGRETPEPAQSKILNEPTHSSNVFSRPGYFSFSAWHLM